MNYVVIENFNGSVTLVTNRKGYTKIFDSKEEAIKEACKCQNGIVVPLDSSNISLLEEMSSFIDHLRFTLGEEIDSKDLEGRINKLLGK